jgi:hypothetical protein
MYNFKLMFFVALLLVLSNGMFSNRGNRKNRYDPNEDIEKGFKIEIFNQQNLKFFFLKVEVII